MDFTSETNMCKKQLDKDNIKRVVKHHIHCHHIRANVNITSCYNYNWFFNMETV